MPDAIDTENWVSRYQNYLTVFASRHISDDEVIKDLVQDTLLTGLENLARFEGRSSIKTWLTGILKIKIFNFYKKTAAKAVFSLDSPAASSNEEICRALTDVRPNPSQALLKQELSAAMWWGISNLPELWQEVLTRKYILDQSADEICTELGLSDSNYWLICHRTRKKLKEALKSYVD